MLSDSTVLSGSLVEQRFLYFFFFKKQQTLYFRTQLLRIEFNCLKAAEQLQGDSLLISPQKFLVLIWSTSKGWKLGSILEPPGGLNSRPWIYNILTLNFSNNLFL